MFCIHSTFFRTVDALLWKDTKKIANVWWVTQQVPYPSRIEPMERKKTHEWMGVPHHTYVNVYYRSNLYHTTVV